MQNSLSKVQKTDPLGYTDLRLDLNCRSSSTQRRTAVNRQQTRVRKAHNRQASKQGQRKRKSNKKERKKERKVQVGNLPKRRRWRRRRTAGGVSWCCSRMANPAPKSKEEENKRIKRQEHALRFINCAKSTYPLRTSICPL